MSSIWQPSPSWSKKSELPFICNLEIEVIIKIMHHLGKQLFTPRKMFFDESNPAAYIRAVNGGLRSQMILQANLEIVLCTDCVSELL